MSRFHKKISIGHLSLTLGNGEIVFVYIGKKRVHIKTLYLRRFSSIKWPAFVISFLIIGFACYHVVPMISLRDATTDAGKGNASDAPVDSIQADDEKKNSLLKSATTDFSIQKENKPLVIYQHKVKKGENLSEIAKKYGISMDTICGSNKLHSYDLISEGSVFIIPNKDGILHKVEKGNRIATLAEKYKVSAQNIINQNSIQNPDFLTLGQTIFIPDAKPQDIFPGYLWPVSSMYITCGFGWRVNPFNWKQREFHQGMDIKSAWEHVRAAKYGKITYAGWLGVRERHHRGASQRGEVPVRPPLRRLCQDGTVREAGTVHRQVGKYRQIHRGASPFRDHSEWRAQEPLCLHQNRQIAKPANFILHCTMITII